MKRNLVVLLVIITIFSFFTGCEQNLDQIRETAVDESKILLVNTSESILPKIIKDTGIIRYMDLEGGFFGIIGKAGNYDPINLPKEFQENELSVEFTAEVLDVYSFHMWATIVHLISIQTTDTEEILIMDTGVVHQKFIQGNPWLIEATTGTYQILNLPDDYKIENLNVIFVGVIKTDIIIIPALWPLVELTSIEKILDTPLPVNLNEKFRLPVEKSAIVSSEKILFTFKSVLQDSRCPKGVQCIWQGEAVILVNIIIDDVNYGNYTISTLYPSNIITVNGYSFQLTCLVPYPVYNNPIDPKSYAGYFIIYPAQSIPS